MRHVHTKEILKKLEVLSSGPRVPEQEQGCSGPNHGDLQAQMVVLIFFGSNWHLGQSWSFVQDATRDGGNNLSSSATKAVSSEVLRGGKSRWWSRIWEEERGFVRQCPDLSCRCCGLWGLHPQGLPRLAGTQPWATCSVGHAGSRPETLQMKSFWGFWWLSAPERWGLWDQIFQESDRWLYPHLMARGSPREGQSWIRQRLAWHPAEPVSRSQSAVPALLLPPASVLVTAQRSALLWSGFLSSQVEVWRNPRKLASREKRFTVAPMNRCKQHRG